MVPAATATRMAITAVCLLLVWRIIQVNALSFDESGRPRIPGVQAAIEASPAERNRLERSAMQDALAENPGDVAALLMIARDSEVSGDFARATAAYRAALNLAPLDPQVLSLVAAHFLRHDDSEGVEILSRLADHYPAARQRAFPLMATTLASGRHRRSWDAIVARNPSWLGAFVGDACARGIDPALLVPVLLNQPATEGAAPAGAACVIDRLRTGDRWEEAYLLWLNLLPRSRLTNVGFIFNGEFQFDPSGIGFDWIIQQLPERQTGYVAEITRTPNAAAGKRALRVVYNGKRQFGIPARQFLALPPGSYVLTGLARQEGIKAVRGIHWTLRCVEKGKILGSFANSERFLGSEEWRPFSMDLTVGESCPGQVLQLEPVVPAGAAAFVSGIAWFDDLAIRQR